LALILPPRFHLITHAFFKALLFLASGSVIHGMEHGAEHVHDHHTDPQDMRYMGGLRQKMPITFWTFLIGGMALSGFPDYGRFLVERRNFCRRLVCLVQ
jgi:NADH-quinone oxidoreductase subunit L